MGWDKHARSEIIRKTISVKRLPGTDRSVEYHVPELAMFEMFGMFGI